MGYALEEECGAMLIHHYRVFYNPLLFKLLPCVPLHNTKYVPVPLGTANINACFQDTGLPGCFAMLRKPQI
jgi:hypothetical protein